jgi:hypothetical protein
MEEMTVSADDERAAKAGAVRAPSTSPGFQLFSTQLRTVMKKNWILTQRDTKTLMREILVPVLFMYLLYTLRTSIKDVEHPDDKTDADSIIENAYMVTRLPMAVSTEHAGCVIPGTAYDLSHLVQQQLPAGSPAVICFDTTTQLLDYTANHSANAIGYGVSLSAPWSLGQTPGCSVPLPGTRERPADVLDSNCTIPYTIYSNYSNVGGGGYSTNYTDTPLWQKLSPSTELFADSGFAYLQWLLDAILIRVVAGEADSTAPLSDTLGVRLAPQYVPGYVDNLGTSVLSQIFPI